jgi:DNA-binding transcriptional LysR family regulator
MDHISRVALFLEVVKEQSFSAAARNLGMTGPALSKQVQNLEDQLGVRLLHRTTRQVTLTEEGAIYNERARRALEDLAEAEHQIQELKARPMGLLRINAPMSFGKQYLAGLIAAFAKEYPDVRMEVDFDDRLVDIIGEGYDVVVRISSLKDSTLIARRLAPCPIVMCASADYAAQYGLPQTPEQLANHKTILYTKNGPQTEWRYLAPDGTRGSVSLNRTFMANSSEMMAQACLQGVGITILPIFAVATHLAAGQLVRVLPNYETTPEINIYAVFPPNRHLSTKVRLFVNWLADGCKALPWECNL